MTVLVESKASEPTRAWCEAREHPWLTYNPWLDRTWCRCGARQEPGQQPHDWDAGWELFHNHPREAPCNCYVRAAVPA
jgi:hypothetical protein